MSISTEITKLNTNLQNSYTACENKGATLPASQNFDNLASTISAIPAGTTPTLASLTVTPSTTAQTITPPSGTDGYNTVQVSAVTASIDSDIVAGNIKSGVNILGVNGSVTALVGETRTVSITSTSGNTFTPSSGKNGITSIKCNPTNKALTITPSSTSQTFTVPSGYSGYGTVTCNAASGGGGGTHTIISADSWEALLYDEWGEILDSPDSTTSPSVLKLVFNDGGALENLFFETEDDGYVYAGLIEDEYGTKYSVSTCADGSTDIGDENLSYASGTMFEGISGNTGVISVNNVTWTAP